MKARDLKNLGIPNGTAMKAAFKALKSLAKTEMEHSNIEQILQEVVFDPEKYHDHKHFGDLARILSQTSQKNGSSSEQLRTEPAPYHIFGQELEQEALAQMHRASTLPVAVQGALMPDAHVGYGLPIGGVLAVENAVIPYAVGVDIACRMKMSVLDLPDDAVTKQFDRLKRALLKETEFGIGAEFKQKKMHKVMDMNWHISPVTAAHKDKAWKQLGTSGSGNHFVEFGILTVSRDDFMLKPGLYCALLSHSGSRGIGALVAHHYSKVARKIHPELSPQIQHLAWLDLDSEEGQEYWNTMQLMGKYAAANHELIHRAIAHNLAADVVLDIENHHNFAWREKHCGKSVIVHRKGATPAQSGIYGIIPGSMATPGYIVRGKGNELSLHSASHGAGRKMSRTAARKKFAWKDLKEFLHKQDVTLLSAGLDEAPMAYKDIDEVMSFQADLVEIMARFDPKIVRMAPAGERPED